MAMLTGAQFADKWGRRLKGAGADVRTGVEGVTEAPGEKASKKADKMLAGIQAAIASGKWQRAVASVSLADWKKAMIDKGINRIPAGVDGAMSKMTQVGEQLMSNLASIKAQVDKMPDNTYEERVQRMLKQIELAHKMQISR